jgi:hypothetical protein
MISDPAILIIKSKIIYYYCYYRIEGLIIRMLEESNLAMQQGYYGLIPSRRPHTFHVVTESNKCLATVSSLLPVSELSLYN